MNLVEAGKMPPLTCPSRQDQPLRTQLPTKLVGQDHQRVLIIDDNTDLLCMIEDLVSMLGHEVQTAPNAMAGVDLARDYRPSVILCDIGLPDMAGYEVARILRCERTLKDVRMVSMSGYGEREFIEKSRDAGFDRHIVKPINFYTLCDLLGEGTELDDTGEYR